MPRRIPDVPAIALTEEPAKIAIDVDPASRSWLERLGEDGPDRDAAIAELHELLLRAARFEVGRRCARLPHIRGGEERDIAQQSADDALMAILGKLGEFRGDSRFTTWAYKFALYEAAAAVRRRAWQGRELPLEAEAWERFSDVDSSPERDAETNDLLTAIREEIEASLSPRQREVLVALALNEVPIDVLADRLGTSRGALYKVLHDARKNLRAALASRGLSIGGQELEEDDE